MEQEIRKRYLVQFAPQTGKFKCRYRTDMFNHETYIEFLEEILDFYCDHQYKKIFLIQDNASYHKHPDTYAWFSKNRKYIEVFNLPPYCPELNGAEKIWWHTRSCATHNRYYETVEELCAALGTTFDFLKNNPSEILQLLADFS
ncbi:transposase [Candidatus Poribacteria bacterium]|nr:transposase [Candidatus Poribacteria bacterium]